jgi:hypothetical protein
MIMNEKRIEQQLVRTIKLHGGICPKLVSPGIDGMPDRMVLLSNGRIGFVEVKAPGKKPRQLQLNRHEMLRRLGFKVFILDEPAQILEIIEEIKMSTIKLKKGEVESVFDRPDLLNAIESHMGYDAMRIVEEYLDDLDGIIFDLKHENDLLKEEIEGLRDNDV